MFYSLSFTYHPGLASVKCDSYRDVTNNDNDDDSGNVTRECCWDLSDGSTKCKSYNLDHDTLDALVESGDEEYQHLQNATGHWVRGHGQSPLVCMCIAGLTAALRPPATKTWPGRAREPRLPRAAPLARGEAFRRVVPTQFTVY